MRPLDHPHGVAAVLTLWSLGALVLHEHVRRTLGRPHRPMSTAALSGGYMEPAMEILTHGLIAPHVRAARRRDRGGGVGSAPKKEDA